MPLVGPFIDTSINPIWYFDSWPGIPGTSPVSTPPNQYSPGAFYRRLVADVTAGVTSCKIWAVPYNSGNNTTQVLAWQDNTYKTTLTYSGTLGTKQSQTLTFDGLSHVLELEEQAVITNITDVIGGTITFRIANLPEIGVLLESDSVGRGFNASDFSKSYFDIVRHGLPANYGFTNWGVSGKSQIGNDASTAIARCFGTTKNIVINTLGINNWNAGGSAPSYQTSLGNWVTTLASSGVIGLKILLVTLPNTNAIASIGGTTPAGPNLSGSSVADFSNALLAVAAANPTICTVLNWGSIYPITPPGIYSADGIHPTDLGMVSLATSLKPSILSL